MRDTQGIVADDEVAGFLADAAAVAHAVGPARRQD